MRRIGSFNLLLIVATAILLLHVVLPLIILPDQVGAQPVAPTLELSYDDGMPFLTVTQSIGGCASCYTYQGVLFDIGGAKVAAITAVRFYAGGSGVLEVVITDLQGRKLFDPFEVKVSGAEWYTISVPEKLVSQDFWVWIKKDDRSMPYHDVRPDGGRSYYGETYGAGGTGLTYGDFMIRAVVRAEIHVGEGQDYATIQEAVDAAGPGLVIVVHPGTYTENVVVNKKVVIMSSDGPSSTIVRAQNPGASTFTVTANGVTISGFSIQGASDAGAAGVRLDGTTDCTVAGNNLLNNHYGVLVLSTSRNNTVVDNNIDSNVYGVWVDGLENNIGGNRFEGNVAPLGSDIYLSATAGGNEIHFNSLVAESGSDQIPRVYSDSNLQTANGVNNWWGSPSGPYHSSANPAGTGASVGDTIRFAPWLPTEPIAVKIGTTTAGSHLINAMTEASTAVVKTGIGTPTVWVARYAGNPGGEFPETAVDKWIDVYFNNTTGVQQVEVRVYYTQDDIAGLKEGSLRLYWWDGTEWKVCSKSGINTTERFVWGMLTPSTAPAITDLSGTPFAVGTTAASGFAWWWILVGILAVILVAVVVRFLLTLLPRRSDYYE